MTEAEPDASAAVPAEGGPGAVGRIPGALFSPVVTFSAIARRPTWVAPLAIWIAVSLFFSLVLLPRVDFDRMIRGSLEKRGTTLPEERIQTIIERQKAIAPVLYNATAVASPVVVSLLVALVLWGAFKAFGWDLTFRQSFGATTHGFLPAVVGSLLFLPVLLRQTTVNPRTMGDLFLSNLGFLVDRQTSPSVHAILQSIDLFSLWTLVLLVIGFSTAARVSRGAAAGVIGAFWGLFVLGKAGFAAIFG
jgi:hypothetical protein